MVAVLLGIGLLGAHCGSAQPAPRSLGGVSIRRVGRAVPAASPGAVVLSPGDWLIQGRDLRVAVGGLRRPAEQRGALLEVARDGMPPDDGCVLLATHVVAGARTFRITPREMTVIDRDGAPALRIVGSVWIARREVEVIREIRIAAIGDGVAIGTRIDLPGDAARLRDVG